MTDFEKKDSIALQSQIVYETCVKILVDSTSVANAEKSLATIGFLSTLAWAIHPGRFFDARLELWAANIGKSIWKSKGLKDSIISKTSASQVVHVASETYDIGGHTRFLLNIVKQDIGSIHSLVLTRQKEGDVPNWLRDEILKSGGTVISLIDKPYAQRVATLQDVLCYQAKKIFYHIHPDDSIAVAALAAVPRPQVITINHADHVFWLGSALSDIVACYRVLSLNQVIDKRGVQKPMLLPIPLAFDTLEIGAKEHARKQLGISEDTIIILTVASSSKFIPSGRYNYYQTVKKILDKNPQVVVKIIGISATDDISKYGFEINDRVELLGRIPSPRRYYEAADIYLDSMPLSSYTSLLEAMYFECFPVLPFCPVQSLNTENEPALKGLITHAIDEQQQLQFLQEAIDSTEFRKKIASRGSNLVKENYVGKGWNRYLEAIYETSSEKIEFIRDLSLEMNEPLFVTQDDIDAAVVADSYGGIINKLVQWVSHYSKYFSFKDLIRLYFEINYNLRKYELHITPKQMIRLLKTKAKAGIKASS